MTPLLRRSPILLFLALAATATAADASSRPTPVPVIFDTDMAGDCDDAGALAVLHALADAGETRLLAVLVNSGDESLASAAAVDAINTYYGRGDIPIGTGKHIPKRPRGHSPYAPALRDGFPNDIGPDPDAPDALAVFRRTLAAQPDGSVVVCSVGAFSNLRDLMESGPDAACPLPGLDLVKKKVRECVLMAGEFPRSRSFDWNTRLDVTAAIAFVDGWPTPSLWTGAEVGHEIFTGPQLLPAPAANPVRRAYELRPTYGRPSLERGRPSYDQTAVLLAVRGAQPQYWKVVQGGRVVIDSEARTAWQPGRETQHRYVQVAGDPAALAGVIGELMARPPVKATADRVLQGLVPVTAPQVKGSHDAEMALVGDRAYIVAEVNDVRPGEAAGWPEIYSAMSIVNLKTLAVERVIPFARGGQAFDNVTLPEGSCFVPRILAKDDRTLRCFFAMEHPGKGEAQTWFIDYDIPAGTFEKALHKARLKTAAGTFDMQPGPFHADAAAKGFSRPAKDYGLYLFDSFKIFDGRLHVALNNFPVGQNALALVHDDLATFEVLGHYNEPQTAQLSESAVNRLPDGTWMAICRNDKGNYHFTTSPDGRTWAEGREMPFVPNGANSKPTFDRIGGVYWLGWQDSARVGGVGRSVFNVDVSRDGRAWERKYRFETEKSFQYPTFREHRGAVYVAVTQGDSSPSRKERIMFGKVEDLARP